MIIFSVYQWIFGSFYYFANALEWKHVLISGLVAIGVAAVFFILQGVGLSAMAKRAGLPNRWRAFVPFVSTYFMGKLAGETRVFGQKMKRAGLYAMIAQIVFAVFTAAVLAAQAILFVQYGGYMQPSTDELGATTGVMWVGLPETVQPLYKFYYISNYISGTISLLYAVLAFLLVMTLYRKYAAKNYMVLSMLEIFVPASKAIVIFVLRNREPIDFDAYMRARQEAYRRRYGQSPYGNPYGNPYGQNPYAGQTPPQGQTTTPPEEPFSEFGGSGSQQGGKTGGTGADDFFN